MTTSKDSQPIISYTLVLDLQTSRTNNKQLNGLASDGNDLVSVGNEFISGEQFSKWSEQVSKVWERLSKG